VETSAAPDTAWKVRARWGNRRLEAAVLDGHGQRRLSLGDEKEDSVPLGYPARVRFEWTEAGLQVRFTAGVKGTLRRRGDAPASPSDVGQRGVVKEDGASWLLTLAGADDLVLPVGTLRVGARRGRGRFQRLPFDARVLVMIALAVLAVWVVIASVAKPPELRKLHGLKP
jgi:hypothetical protein